METKLGDGQYLDLSRIEKNLSLDTVRNEYLLHSLIHLWLGRQARLRYFSPLNERVYTRLFINDVKDPWMGLLADGAFLGLDGNGVRVSKLQKLERDQSY
jgi:hypothetical protein